MPSKGISFFAHTCCFFVISIDMIFAESRIWTALSSSRMFPSDDCRVSKIWSSISLSCLLLAADCRIKAFLSSSSSGLLSRDVRHSHDVQRCEGFQYYYSTNVNIMCPTSLWQLRSPAADPPGPLEWSWNWAGTPWLPVLGGNAGFSASWWCRNGKGRSTRSRSPLVWCNPYHLGQNNIWNYNISNRLNRLLVATWLQHLVWRLAWAAEVPVMGPVPPLRFPEAMVFQTEYSFPKSSCSLCQIAWSHSGCCLSLNSSPTCWLDPEGQSTMACGMQKDGSFLGN